jgi:glycosyltransferase involved in cell wall biosynthesis
MHGILHVIGVRWWSAIAAYAVNLAGAQARAGNRVRVAALSGSPAEEESRRRGLRVPITFGPNAWDQARLRRALVAALADERADVVHVHTGVGHLAAELARRGIDAALVRTRGDVRAPRRTPWNRWLYARADAVALSGSFLLPTLAPFDIDRSRLSVVIGGVDPDRFSPGGLPDRTAAREAHDLPARAFVVGIAGRLSPVKGHAYAIDALAEVPDDVYLLISGEESQITRAMLLERATARGVRARVRLTGRMSDVREIFAALDVGLVASTGSEAICRVAGEMMASGLPVIASRVSVLPDMIQDGEDGVLVPPGDASAIASAIGRLHEDGDRRARIGAAARSTARGRLSLATQAERYREIYERAIARRRSR